MVVFQIEIGRRYDHAEFREGEAIWLTATNTSSCLDLRRLMKLCGVSNREVVFLFVDTQIVDDAFLEDLNALLHTDEVPNLFRHEDLNEVGVRRWLLSLSLGSCGSVSLDSRSIVVEYRSTSADTRKSQSNSMVLPSSESQSASRHLHESIHRHVQVIETKCSLRCRKPRRNRVGITSVCILRSLIAPQ
jgi:hypothetical protein